jgi:hypothetical protein
MRSSTISAILFGVFHVAIAGEVAAAMPRDVAPAIRDRPAAQSPALLPVGDGRRGHGYGRHHHGHGWGWGPPPAYHYGPPRVPRRPPPVYYAPPPAYYYYAPPPPTYYVPPPGVSLQFRF